MQKRVGEEKRLLILGCLFLLFSFFIFLFANARVFRFTSKYIDQGIFFLQDRFSPLIKVLASPSSPEFSEKDLDTIASEFTTEAAKKEIRALRDQFQTESPKSSNLLPSRIIGFVGFVPLVSQPKAVVLDNGSKDGVSLGAAVVYKNYLVGNVQKVTENRCLVALLGGDSMSFTAKVSNSEATGIILSKQNELLFDKVLPSEVLHASDIVVTAGSEDLLGKGFPPDLLVGKIVDIDKKSSALFQSAKIKRFIDPQTLTHVFVVMP